MIPSNMEASKDKLWTAAVEAFEAGHNAVLALLCARLLEHEPGNFTVRMLRAHALVKMKRFDDASELLEGANPDDERKVVLWHRTAGDYYAERGDHQAAEDEYASALALADEATSDLVLDLVEAQLNQGNGEAALRSIESYLGGMAEDIDERELLAYAEARALRNLGRVDEALDAAGRAGTFGEPLVAELEQLRGWL